MKARYREWFRDMLKYGFTSGDDYAEISAKLPGQVGRPRKDHVLTKYGFEEGADYVVLASQNREAGATSGFVPGHGEGTVDDPAHD